MFCICIKRCVVSFTKCCKRSIKGCLAPEPKWSALQYNNHVNFPSTQTLRKVNLNQYARAIGLSSAVRLYNNCCTVPFNWSKRNCGQNNLIFVLFWERQPLTDLIAFNENVLNRLIDYIYYRKLIGQKCDWKCPHTFITEVENHLEYICYG